MPLQQLNINIASPAELPAAAKQLLDYAGDKKIFLFYGPMGAGKTTYIKAICRLLGVYDVVTSPTFSIVNEYEGAANSVYHFDFYRLKTQTEALDMGYEDYFYSDKYCLIEWPEKISDLLPPHYVKITIQVTEGQGRALTFENI